MIDYRLHVFRRVAEIGSLTKAAQVLHLSQPAVTKHLKLLEEELQRPLFVRSRTGVTLTDAGVIFLRHVQETEKARASVLERLQGPAGNVTGTLRLGSSRTVTAYYLPRLLVSFYARHPSVTCEMTLGNTDFVIGLMLEQRLDAALVEGPCRRREIHAQPFYKDEIIWVAAPSDPLLKNKTVAPKLMLERPLVIREVGSGTRRVMEMALRQRGVSLSSLRVKQEMPSTEAIKRMVAAGAGIAYVSRLSVEAELASGALRQIPCPRLEIERDFSILTPQGPDPVGIVRAFTKHLIDNSR
ncbi:MAG TPA: LysR family transcriptional regulator [Candidatus Methylacidiphilales bacterium]|jgi:DNA-binding transcriptional LysR family regulator|nr:LysR family transcriptional regulator [Candidatus Methylacidiphilales bacterium]